MIVLDDFLFLEPINNFVLHLLRFGSHVRLRLDTSAQIQKRTDSLPECWDILCLAIPHSQNFPPALFERASLRRVPGYIPLQFRYPIRQIGLGHACIGAIRVRMLVPEAAVNENGLLPANER